MVGRFLAALLAASLALTTSGLRKTDKPLESTEQGALLDKALDYGLAGAGVCGPVGEPDEQSETPEGPEEAELAERGETATYQDAETQNFTDGSLALPVFKNILLVLHCRAPAEVCRAREWVFKRYAPYFGDVFYMTPNNHCAKGPGDPNVCVAQLMETRGVGRDGILYAHFDALINPVNLAVDFDKHAMGYFMKLYECKIGETLTNLTDIRCATRGPASKALPNWLLRWKVWGRQVIDDPFTIYVGNNDIFYTPREAYTQFAFLARAFYPIDHEIAGPNIRNTIARRMNISNKCLQCRGSCQTKLPASIALEKDFKCGHKFDLADPTVELAVPKVIDHR